jgi:transcriptional regulator with AAA-type ATPase domain
MPLFFISVKWLLSGYLFLDEIGDLPLSIQDKLWRAIQLGKIQRVGSDKAIFVFSLLTGHNIQNFPKTLA